MPSFTPETFLADLRAALPADVIRDPEPRHLEEPRGRWQGLALCLAAPTNTDQVATIVKLCHRDGVPVVPLGGGTGLVGGQVKPDGAPPVVITLERMRAVRGLYAEENVIVVEAGAKLADVQAAARAAGRMFPLSLAAEGTCTIGGNLATNAGGVNVIRYGNARDLCLGLEVVLADGSVVQGLKRLRKDNTGFDLRNLMIGSEGALGVITAASLRLVTPPPETGAALMIVEDPAAALKLLALAERHVSGGISAFELIHGNGMRFLAEKIPDLRLPFAEPPEWTVLIDLGLPKGNDVSQALEEIFVEAAEEGLVTDGIIAQSEGQRAAFWAMREHIPEANRLIGAITSHDISLPLSEIPGFIAEASAEILATGPWRINCFGHLGDGNLHFNTFPLAGEASPKDAALRQTITDIVHERLHARGGSISAEHGIGRAKAGELEKYADPARLAAMRAIKVALDPKGIMNPGVILR